MVPDGPPVEHYTAEVYLNGMVVARAECPNAGEYKIDNTARGSAISMAHGKFIRNILNRDIRDGA